MNQALRRRISLAFAILAMASGLASWTALPASAGHKVGVAAESRSYRQFLARLDRAGHDYRVMDQRFFAELQSTGPRSRERRAFRQYVEAGRIDWYRSEPARYWVKANLPGVWQRLAVHQAPRVFVRVLGAPKLGAAVRYQLSAYGAGQVVFVERRDRADLVVEVEGLISDARFTRLSSSFKTERIGGKKRSRRKGGPGQTMATYTRVREKVVIEYDFRLKLISGRRLLDRERAYGRVTETFRSVQNYNVVVPVGYGRQDVYPSRKVAREHYNATPQGRREIVGGLRQKLAARIAERVTRMRFPSRYELKRAGRRDGRKANGFSANRLEARPEIRRQSPVAIRKLGKLERFLRRF